MPGARNCVGHLTPPKKGKIGTFPYAYNFYLTGMVVKCESSAGHRLVDSNS